jgi:hypothetical protein
MTAVQFLLAFPLAMRNGVVAGLARIIHKFIERCLSAGTASDNVWGERTMRWQLILWVTRQLATVDIAIIRSSTSILAAERTLKPRVVGIII